MSSRGKKVLFLFGFFLSLANFVWGDIDVSLTVPGNIILSPNKGVAKLSLSGSPQNIPLKIRWEVLDFYLNPIATSEIISPQMTLNFELPQLESGYYILRIKAEGEGITSNEKEISFGVITPLPKDFNRKASPICLDAGMSWNAAPDEKRLDLACYLCEIAGIGTLRDRLAWGEVEKEAGKFDWGKYTQSAKAQAEHGITVYQIFHSCPAWASNFLTDGRKEEWQPPRDPILVYKMVNRLVKDLGKEVRYFEVWNEPNLIGNRAFFNGRPEDYAAILKAAYLGAKDADPRFGILTGSATGVPGEFYEQVYQNNAGEYFDICNQHYYDSPEGLFSFLPDVVGKQLRRYGLDKKPIWITEMGAPPIPARLSENGDFREAERQQASYLVRAYASAFANGISRVFYFYLNEFLEGTARYGIIRSDQTPRPTYIALVNLIRQLDEAKCAGWKRIEGGYLVAFKRNARENVVVVWGEEGQKFSLTAQGPIVDIVGRVVQKEEEKSGLKTVALSAMPVYVRGMSYKDVARLNLEKPKPAEDWKPSPDSHINSKRVWLQLEVNPEQPRSGDPKEKQGAFMEPGKSFTLTAWVNNYSDKPATAAVICQPDDMFSLRGEARTELKVGPWQRGRHDFVLIRPLIGKNIRPGQKMGVTVLMKTQNHQEKGRVYLQSSISDIKASEEKLIFGRESGVDVLSQNNSPKIQLSWERDPSVQFEGKPSLKIEAAVIGEGDVWAFPQIHLPPDLDLSRFKGIAVWSYVAPGGEKNIQFILQMIEGGGVWLTSDGLRTFGEAGWHRDVVLLNSAQLAPWSPAPPPDGKLNLSKARGMLLGWGAYTGSIGEKVVFWLGKVSAINW